MAKEALGADDVFLVHPICILCIDDSRVFAFEGTVNNDGEWSSKLFPPSQETIEILAPTVISKSQTTLERREA